MDTLIDMLVEKTGLDRAMAEKVANFIQENASEIPKWLGQEGGASGLMDAAKGFLNKE